LGVSLDIAPTCESVPKHPYQASPEAWLGAEHPDYYWAEYDAIVWQPPQDLGLQPLPRGVHFYFEVSPEWRSLVSIAVSGKAWPGITGQVPVGLDLGHRAFRPGSDRRHFRSTHH
jgi:hypothetical protein